MKRLAITLNASRRYETGKLVSYIHQSTCYTAIFLHFINVFSSGPGASCDGYLQGDDRVLRKGWQRGESVG